MRWLIGGDCHARRYRLSTGARAGRLPVSDLDYVVCTDSVPVQQERHDLRFPGLGQRKEVPCLCGELRRFTKSEATITTILTANLPFGSSALDVSRLPGPPQADSGRQRASRARTNDMKTSLPFIASGFALRLSLLYCDEWWVRSGIGNSSYEYRLRRGAFRLLVLLWDQGRR